MSDASPIVTAGDYLRRRKFRRTNLNAPTLWFRALGCAVALMHVGSTSLVAETVTNEVQESIRVLKRLTLDELLNQQVVTTSRSEERISDAAAAVQVVTSEDIKRSSAKTLPEALRLASNLEVAKVNSSSWAISARGFNNTLANKLLVMIDGRTVYTPLYAGVFWDVQNVVLEDVDRIEVVSGPGGTLWGANAVNGVINVITKSAKDTQGLYVSGSAGSYLQDSAAVRYGCGNGSNLFVRVYAQRYDFNSTKLANGNDAPDEWDMTHGGFRLDWEASEADMLTFQGDYYGGMEEVAAGHTFVDGQNILGRWTHVLSPESDWRVQMYFDRTWRHVPNSYAEDLKTYDIDVQHRFPLGDIQSITWGIGYRFMQDRIKNSPALAFLPAHKDLDLYSGFVQDEITIVPERLRFTVGSKLEHNDYSGFEFQPSARLAWTPDEKQTIWGAVSRAVRSPSRIDTDFFAPAPPVPTNTPNLAGGPDFDSEKLLSFELGYRVRPIKPLWISLAAYYNFYDDLRSLDQPTTNNFILDNHFKGEVWGIECWAEYLPTPWWRLRGGYNYLNKNLWANGGVNVNAGVREGNDPEHQFSFQSILDLPANFHFDVVGRYVHKLPAPNVSSYFAVDARLSWQYRNVEISLVGQNLTDPDHPEFGTQEIPRGVFGTVTLRF